MVRFTMAVASIALLATPAFAAPCKDAKGKFVKCPPAAAAPHVVKDAKGKCRIASGPKKGQFVKCP